MSGGYKDRVDDLRSEAARAPEGPLQVDLLEEAVRVADVHQDLDLGYESRIELVDAACWAGFPDRMLVAYTWCLAQFDRHPGRFEVFQLYWMYKWILNEVTYFLRIPRDRIDAAFEDARRRYGERGFSPRPLHQLRTTALSFMGHPAEAEEQHRKWMDAPRDSYSDCAACELSCRVDYLIEQRRDEEAVETARPLLLGRQRCKEEPGRTFSRILRPLVRLGRAAEAIPCYLKAARFTGRNPKFIWAAGNFLSFLGLTGNLPRGLRLVEGRFRIALETRAPSNRFDFLLGLRLFLGILAETREQPLKLRLPDTFPLFRPDASYPLPDLLAWCDRELSDLARQFDARNGTDALARRVAAHGDLRKHAVSLPISSKP